MLDPVCICYAFSANNSDVFQNLHLSDDDTLVGSPFLILAFSTDIAAERTTSLADLYRPERDFSSSLFTFDRLKFSLKA